MTQSMRRIAIFVPYLAAGGAERSMLNLAAGLAARGYPVDIVLASATGPLLVDVPGSVRLVDLGVRRVVASLRNLVGYLRRERPVALLAILHAGIIALWAGRISGVPVRMVIGEHSTLSCQVSAHHKDLRMQLLPHMVRRFYPWADCVVAVSKGVAEDLHQYANLPRQQIRVIYNPVVTPELRKRAMEPLDHRWFAHGEPPVILAVGRLTKEKDFPTLLHAFARIREVREARLVIVGEGEQRLELESTSRMLRIQSDVELPGFVRNPYPIMTRSSVFALSSRWEGLPGALIEAMYCGLPLVSTDCPSGPREILADGRYGRLVPVGDVTKLASALDAALCGEVPRPPRESWRPFELDAVVTQYEGVLLDGGHEKFS